MPSQPVRNDHSMDFVPTGHLADIRRAVHAAGHAHYAHAHAIDTGAPEWLIEATHDQARQATDHAHSIIDRWILSAAVQQGMNP